MASLLKRFAEPSSYAGLAGIFGTFGINMPSPLFQSATLVLAGICGAVAFFLPDGTVKPDGK